MVDYIKHVAVKENEITEEVRNLFSIAYKNVVGNHRSAWRAIANFESKEVPPKIA